MHSRKCENDQNNSEAPRRENSKHVTDQPNALRRLLVKHVYGDHNKSKDVRNALNQLISTQSPDFFGLNIGSGDTFFSENIKNVDITPGANTHYTASIESLPFEDNTVDLIITQEVLEHVENPIIAAGEIARVLKPGGKAYIQVPFIIGYHPCPSDYWRFTHEGIEQLARQGRLAVIARGYSVGPATGFYRIAVEFAAVLASTLYAKLYLPTKAVLCIALYPLKLLDPLLKKSPQAHRIPGGVYVICQKKNN